MTEEISECITLAKTELRVAQQRIAAQLAGYAPSSSGSDAERDELLAQRRRIDAALDALSDGPELPSQSSAK